MHFLKVPKPVWFVAVVVTAQLAFAGMANAATPANGSVGPANGSTNAWDFAAVGPGANTASGAETTGVCTLPLCDAYTLNVVLPQPDGTFYQSHVATLTLTYTWNSTSPDDMDIFAFGPDGTESGPGSPDDQSTGPGKETLQISNPQSGAWTIESFVGVTPVPTASHTVAKLTYGPAPVPTPPPHEFATPEFRDISPGVHYQTADAIGRDNAGEPSVGIDWRNGQPVLMYMAGTQVSRVHVNFGANPPSATWTDVTPAQHQIANEDAILFVDQVTHRTFATGLLVAGANQTFSDNDGTSWTQGTFPEPHGPDHETVGGGPYAGPSQATGSYSHAVYYCSQNIVQSAGAFCSRSDDGGLTWNPSVMVFGSGSPCGAIHGHVKVGPDGSVYVPQDNCSHPNNSSGQGGAVSRDNGQTWSYWSVPGISARPANAGTDPSIGIGAKNSVYEGFENGNGHPLIAVSHDHGATWSTPVDVGIPYGIQNTKFPEVVAGDDNRAAFAFLGTTTAGDDQSAAFKGVWHLYVSETFDSGKHWVTVDADPGNVIQRGCIWNGGGSNACRNLLDFNDIGVDHNGRVYVAFTDGCKNINFSYASVVGEVEGVRHGPSNCESDPSAYKDTDKVNFDGLVVQTCGESLYERHDRDFRDWCPAPRVSAISPLNGATKVSRSVTPSATFDEAPTTTQSFQLRNVATGQLVAGTVLCGRECHKLTFVPNNKLAASTKYQAIAKVGNKNGVATANWTFTTGKT